MRRLTPGLMLLWLTAFATDAHAGDGGMWGSGNAGSRPSAPREPRPWGCVCVGPYTGGRLGEASGWTVGGEASFFVHPDSSRFEGMGGFFQAERTFGQARSTRLATGVEIGGPLGLELGMGLRLGERGTTPQLHVAPYASIGYAHIALRLAPGLGGYGSEAGLFVALKLPFLWGEGSP